MTNKKLPIELDPALPRKMLEERRQELHADMEAAQESIELIPLALDVAKAMTLTKMKAGLTNRQASMVLRYALALIRAESEDEFYRSVNLIVDEFRERPE